MFPDFIYYSRSSSWLRSPPDFLSCCVPHSSRPSSLGNIVLLFSCSVLLSSVLRLISNPKLSTPCYVPCLVIVLVVHHNRLIIFPFCRYIHSHGYIYKQVMYNRISSYIDHSAPIAQTSSPLRLLQCTPEYFVNSVNSVTPKFGTTWSWGGATHKLKPSPFRQLRFSRPTPCSVLPLNTFPWCSMRAEIWLAARYFTCQSIVRLSVYGNIFCPFLWHSIRAGPWLASRSFQDISHVNLLLDSDSD